MDVTLSRKSLARPFRWENRNLAGREIARLQTFRDGPVFTGNRGSVQRQIGNAVPSLLAEVVARAIGEQLFGIPLPDRLTFAVAPRRPIPRPKRPRPVAKKYLALQGEHAAHPGRGYAARSAAKRLASPFCFLRGGSCSWRLTTDH
jgi:DNA (cytosine-5)-methyltransferase 1